MAVGRAPTNSCGLVLRPDVSRRLAVVVGFNVAPSSSVSHLTRGVCRRDGARHGDECPGDHP